MNQNIKDRIVDGLLSIVADPSEPKAKRLDAVQAIHEILNPPAPVVVDRYVSTPFVRPWYERPYWSGTSLGNSFMCASAGDDTKAMSLLASVGSES